MGAHNRGTIKADMSSDAQSGNPPFVKAIESYEKNVYSLTIEAPIPSMQAHTVYLYPASGIIYQVKALFMVAVATGVSGGGIHQIIVHASDDIEVLLGGSTYSAGIVYNYGYWYTAGFVQQPTEEVSQRLALDSLIGTLDDPIYFIYNNVTTNPQDNDVIIEVMTREGVF